MKKLPNHLTRLQHQNEWMRNCEHLKAWEELVISSNDGKELSKQILMPSAYASCTSNP